MMQQTDDIVHVTIGTAGHIDHGKSTLIKAITGTDPDRLKEEQERGMTIDLGYAGFHLKDGREVGIIDVPGHERFIKNMVAGATGIDFVILVVAADDSVMPQTREHLEIMALLGIDRGMTVITKTDIVEEELAELVEEDVRDFLKGTFLENAPLLRVSAVSGKGIPEFVETLHQQVMNLEPKSDSGVFRMPVQRVFSAKGYGAVTTGVPVSGKVSIGDKLELLPQEKSCRVRGIQVYGRDREWARTGHRTALNLADLDYNKVARGNVVCESGYFEPVRIFDARFDYLSRHKNKLGIRTQIRLHVGTDEAIGVMVLLDKKNLSPGESACVQYRLRTPVVAGLGDRCVVRLQSPMVTIGGGTLLGSAEGRPRILKSRMAEFVRRKDRVLGNSLEMLSALAAEKGVEPFDAGQLKKIIQLRKDDIESLVEELVERGDIIVLPNRRRYLQKEGANIAGDILVKSLEKYFRENPLKVHCDLKHLVNLTHMEEDVLQMASEKLRDEGKLELESGKISIPGRSVRLTREEEELASQIEKIYMEERFSGPSFGDLVPRLKGPQEKVKKVFDFLQEKGDIVRIGDNTYIHGEALDDARVAVLKHFNSSEELSPADMKNLLGASRKFAIPLMEHFDREGLTLRKGNVRVKVKHR